MTKRRDSPERFKILLASHHFAPSTGGIETMSLLLAEEFVKRGHAVTVLTQTPAQGADVFPFEVVRRPQGKQLLKWVRWCDVFFHNNISLQAAWPLLLVRRPWVVAHQTWLAPDEGETRQSRLKRLALRYAASISISKAVADHIKVPSTIIGNAFRDDVFRLLPGIKREIELVFVGRLVRDKGADVLIEALGLLKKSGVTPTLTVVGTGPELDVLQRLAHDNAMSEQVRFAGQVSGPELAQLLNAHKIMVVPSRWKEPFGIVALEGIACGCVVVGSEMGGLPDAIGPCGVTFPNGDVPALAEVLRALLCDSARRAAFQSQSPTHLHQHSAQAIADAYLKVFRRAMT